MGLTVDGVVQATSAEGFLLDHRQWNESVAIALARAEGIKLNEAHWEILHFIRDYYREFKHLPNARMFAAAIRKRLGEDKAQSRYLHTLFPQGPLKYACKLAGLPKPPTCL
ncbi:MAG: TusE/DsrC/DsvC family sulfur relay protein [Methylomonas sp.]|nr:TusE/DsrC/DsvC family sulfur relay protein [Methylomonas sp.]PPD20782.1 MAG: sulfurtransferase TusE [Methylomonas sp.]PPD27295.1 MAG: sulfurtransferase TusE [Methylomonas sp.]PPD39266.1 MAG: sulfurtransferase TusE [Methylomonas sp.]PPD40736.1 MAG: sulfurtransferase TusE [Methylomonas sp.]